MRQRAVRVGVVAAVCIAAGVVVTVAVAWGCAAYAGASLNSLSERPDADAWPRAVPDSWPPPHSAFHHQAGGTRIECYMGGGSGRKAGQPALCLLLIQFSGWPMQALESQGRTSDGWPGHGTWAVNGGIALRTDRWLPFLLLWPGFAVDTAFYGSLVFLAWKGPGHIRRRSRVRRGECVRCGYPRAGLAGDAACPECGAG